MNNELTVVKPDFTFQPLCFETQPLLVKKWEACSCSCIIVTQPPHKTASMFNRWSEALFCLKNHDFITLHFPLLHNPTGNGLLCVCVWYLSPTRLNALCQKWCSKSTAPHRVLHTHLNREREHLPMYGDWSVVDGGWTSINVNRVKRKVTGQRSPCHSSWTLNHDDPNITHTQMGPLTDEKWIKPGSERYVSSQISGGCPMWAWHKSINWARLN